MITHDVAILFNNPLSHRLLITRLPKYYSVFTPVVIIPATSYRSKNKRISLKTSGVYLYTMSDPKILMGYLDSSDEKIDKLQFAQQLISLAYSTNSESGVKSGGSRPGKRPNINRFAEEGALRLYNDYFTEIPIYTKEQFRRRFHMRRSLFLRIAKALERKEYFIQKADATGKLELTNLQKCTAAIRQLAYGSPTDATDEYV